MAAITNNKVKQEINRAVKQDITISEMIVATTAMAITFKDMKVTQPNAKLGMSPVRKERYKSKMTIITT